MISLMSDDFKSWKVEKCFPKYHEIVTHKISDRKREAFLCLHCQVNLNQWIDTRGPPVGNVEVIPK